MALVVDDNAVGAGMLHKFSADAQVVRREYGDIQYEIALQGAGIRASRTWLAAS